MRAATAIVLCLAASTAAGTNPTHYGDPAGGCESDEKVVQVQGVSGDFCSPPCGGGTCPSDVPTDVSAQPACALQTTMGDKYCALLCTPSILRRNGAAGECGDGTCQPIQGLGICTYVAARATFSEQVPVTASAHLAQVAAMLWPTVVQQQRVTLYTRSVYPPTWRIVGRASTHQRMHLLIAVKQRNLMQLEEKFWDVSNPKSRSWRSFMTADEINHLIGSTAADMATVSRWLQAGLSQDATVKHTADSVEVRCSVGDVERLFQTEINIYVHDNGHTVLRTLGDHSVPADVRRAIDFVEGMTDFPMHRTSSRKTPHGRQPRSNVAMVAPQTLLQMYSVPQDYTASSVSQGPAEFQGDASFNQQDLQAFFQQTDLPAEQVNNIVGPFDGTVPDTEATLDIQYIMSVGQKQVNWYWTSENWMYQWSNNFFNTAKVPDAVSVSWGWAEDQQCSSGIAQAVCQTLGIDSKQYVQRTNTEFQKIGLRGVSLLVASGDSGANGRSDPDCTDVVLHASFPGSSPYVTAVGATQLQNPQFDLRSPPPACSSQGSGYACASGGTEVAVSVGQAGFTSGGGFSTYTPMPAYQRAAVQSYLQEEASKLPPAGYYNSSNRGYPDVSAMGSNFLVYMSSEGGWSLVGGTSAATPTFAGVSAYLNDLSYKKSGKPLGFLNPLLYQMHQEAPGAFTDVTQGDNICTESGCSPGCQGYYAAKGWDPVTGLGTPVAQKMIVYLSQLLDHHAALHEQGPMVV